MCNRHTIKTKKMKTKILALLCVLSTFSYAQEKKTLSAFAKLQVNSALSVYLQKSDTPYVIADMGVVKVDVNNNTLVLGMNKKNSSNDNATKVTVGYTQIDQVTVGGASSVKNGDTLRANNLQITTSGASSCKLILTCNEVSCAASGASEIILSGKANQIKAETEGASTLKSVDLLANEADVNTSGVSTAKVYASKKLKGNTSGASNLKFSGNPTVTQLNETGSSSIKEYNKATSSTIKIEADSIDVSETKHDSTKHYKLSGGRYEFIVHNRKNYDSTHTANRNFHNWSGIELAENGFLTSGNNITLPANNDYMSLNYGIRNLSWNLNLFEKDFRFAHKHLQIVTGLGFSFNSYNLKNKTTLNADSSYTSNLNSINNGSITLIKNKLRESFITVPLLLELNTSKTRSKNFHIAAGVIGGLKLGSSTKQVFKEDNKTFKDVRKDDYNLYPFKLDATVRIGYGNFTMFATYSLTPLFQAGKGPELYPFNIGLRIVPW